MDISIRRYVPVRIIDRRAEFYVNDWHLAGPVAKSTFGRSPTMIAVRAFTSVMRECVAMRGVTVRDPLLHERKVAAVSAALYVNCLLYTSPSPRDRTRSRMPSSA